MATLVPATVTPVSIGDISLALAAAAPDWTQAQRDYATALLWLETGRGKSMVQFNAGNLMAAGYQNGSEYWVWSGSYWRPSWYADETSSLHAKMLEGNAPSAFRAYASLAAGVVAFVRLLSGAKYSALQVAANADDPEAYAVALATYSPDYGVQTTATIRSLVASVRAANGTAVPVSGGSFVSEETRAASIAAVIPVFLALGLASFAAAAVILKGKLT